MAPPTIKIGFPRDLVVVAKNKAQTLTNLLSSRARAWDGFFDGLTLAYIQAHTNHTQTLNAIKERIRNQTEFLKSIVFGVVLPSFIGGGMAVLVANKGMSVVKAITPVSQKWRPELSAFAVSDTTADLRSAILGGTSTVTKDLIKQELSKALGSLVPVPGSEWDSVGDQPIKFFVQLRKSVNDYVTDATHAVELAKRGPLDAYISLLDTHLLSPFIQNAPMDTSILYSDKELAPVFEVFLWVVWARARDVKYWVTQITLATDPDDRGFVRKLIDAGLKDDDAINLVKARDAVMQLDPILDRLLACGVRQEEVTQGAGWDNSRRLLNILWVRLLGEKRRDTLLADMVANLDAKVPKSALDNGPLTKARRLM